MTARVNTYSDLEYLDIKILPTSSPLPGMIRKVKENLYTVISRIFLFTNSSQNKMQCRGLFGVLNKIMKPQYLVLFVFKFFSIASGVVGLL